MIILWTIQNVHKLNDAKKCCRCSAVTKSWGLIFPGHLL